MQDAALVMGIDVDFEVIEYARLHYPKCIFRVGDVQQLGILESNSCGVIVCHVVFGGDKVTKEMLKFCGEVKRLLKPKGRFYGSNKGLMLAAAKVFKNIREYSVPIPDYESYIGSMFECRKD